MNRYLKLCIVSLFVFVSYAEVNAQGPRVGGYKDVSVKDAGVVAAADFAVAEKSKTEKVTLVEIKTAQQQVVAGMNYKLTISVKSEDKAKEATVVVYRKLDKTQQLTSWEWKGEKK